MAETNDLGWTADPRQLLRYLVMREMAGGESDCVEIASDLTSGPDEVQEVFADLIYNGLAEPAPRRVGDDGVHDAYLNPTGKAQVSGWDAGRTPSREKRACMSALLCWLDATEEYIRVVDEFAGTIRSHYFGLPFSEQTIRNAAHELDQQGLVDGLRGDDTMFRPALTTLGQMVVSQYDGDVIAWLATAQGTRPAGDTFHFNNSNNIALANRSPGSRQSVHVGGDAAEQVLNLAAALEQMVDALGLDPADVARAYGLVGQLREAAEVVDDEPERTHRLLGAVKDIAVNGAGSAAGTALVALATVVGQSI